jgi:hypothetical protein
MLVDDAPDAFLEGGRSEIDQQAERKAHQSQVGEQLLVVDGGELLDGFEFDHKATLDHQIRPKTLVEANPALFNRDRLLAHDGPAMVLQDFGQDRLVNRFQQAGPQVAVQVKCGIDDGCGEFFHVRHSSVKRNEMARSFKIVSREGAKVAKNLG